MRFRNTRYPMVIVTAAATAAVVLLSASSCRPAASKLDDLANVLKQTPEETKAILGAADNTAAESSAARWMAELEKVLPNDAVSNACGALLNYPDDPAQQERLLQFVSMVPSPTDEASILQQELGDTLEQDEETPGLWVAVTAFRAFYCD
jgi:hypothetical protein